MGCGYEFICIDCKKTYNLGYGSYGTWLTLDKASDFEDPRIPREHLSLRKNQNVLKCLLEHEGHAHLYASEDFTHVRDGNLYIETGYYGSGEGLLVKDYRDFESIDLTDD